MASGAASSRSASERDSQPATDASLTGGAFHPVIRIGKKRGGKVYRLQFPSGVYLREYPLLRVPGVTLGERLFLFRNRNGPGP